MKQKIRRGVFETNSSSSHSIQLVDSDKASYIAYDTMIENFRDSLYDYDDEVYHIENGDTLILEGFYETTGEENHFVSHEIYTPFEKIQYLFSVVYQYLKDKHYYIESELSDDERSLYGEDYVPLNNGYIYNGKKFIENDKFSVTTKCFEEFDEYKWFKKLVLDYFDSDAFRVGFSDGTTEIKKLEIADEVVAPSLYSDFGDALDFDNIFTNKKVFTEFFNKVMDNKKTILLMDVPYSPYRKPEMFKH